MPWNWQLPNWPNFQYDKEPLFALEKQFLLELGKAAAFLRTLDERDFYNFAVEILTQEGVKSARIEGEVLDRESLQSSIKYHFGLSTQKRSDQESKMAKLLCDVYKTFHEPLSHEMLEQWHAILFEGSSAIADKGKYRTHTEPMQIVSNRYGSPRLYFEAPPSKRVKKEMDKYIAWFNSPATSTLERAAIAHLYFESIHPFEDGNGRVGRLLVEKVLSQGIGQPVLVAVSKRLEMQKKDYYAALEKCNCTLEVHHWMEFFASVILQAQKEAMELLFFLIEKAKFLRRLTDQLNPRQLKVLLRMFKEGPSGFKGGLSADKYIAITKTSRATATRDLQDLVEKGALVKMGELRHTRYHLALLA
jgi:Fic family protein